MGHGDTGERWRGNGRGHARHNLKGNSFLDQCQSFLSASAKEVGVSPLQAHYGVSRLRLFYEKTVDPFLIQLMPAGILSHIDQFRPDSIQHPRVKQPVKQHHIRLPK